MTLAVPTNVGNLLAMYGLGVLAPEPALPKYYPDPSEPLGGRLPLLELSDGHPLVPGDPDPIEAPVLVELTNAASKAVGSGMFPGLIPLSAVDKVHVASQAVIEESLARPYSDVDPSTIRWEASADYFQAGERLDLDQPEDPPPPAVTADMVTEAERALGAVVLMLTAGPADPDVAKLAAEAFSAIQESGGDLPPDLSAFATGDPDAEAWLLERVISTIGSAPAKGVPDGLEMLAAIADGAPETVARSLEFMTRVLRFETEFTRFPEGDGLSAARALLLFLLRPEPKEIGSWMEEEVHAGPSALSLACAFAGLRAGYRRIPLDLRGKPALRDRCGQILANRVNAETSPSTKEFGRKMKARATVTEGVSSFRVTFKSGRRILSEHEIAKPSPRLRLIGEEWSDEDYDEARRIAIGLRWYDALYTVVAYKDWRLPATDGGGSGPPTEFRFRGWAPPSVDVVRFRQRLDEASDTQLFRALDKVPPIF